MSDQEPIEVEADVPRKPSWPERFDAWRVKRWERALWSIEDTAEYAVLSAAYDMDDMDEVERESLRKDALTVRRWHRQQMLFVIVLTALLGALCTVVSYQSRPQEAEFKNYECTSAGSSVWVCTKDWY